MRDALIAATCLEHGLKLATLNTSDFDWIAGLTVDALPDFAAKKIGQGLGMQEDEVATLTKFFNRGQRAPVNSSERYARAFGEGVGATLPFTGILAYAAKTAPLVKVAEPGAGVLKSIANRAISGPPTD